MGAADSEDKWKGFVFSFATESDASEICIHVRDFFLRDEPMNQYLGWTEDNAADHDRMIYLVLTHGLSFVVRDSVSREIAGVNLLMDTRLPGIATLFSPSTHQMSPHFKKISSVLNKLKSSAAENAKRLFPCEFHAEIFITSVGEKYRGFGLAKEMYGRMLTLLKTRGFPMIQSGFSSPATRAIAQKLGFEELARLNFMDEIDEKGEKLFPTAKEGEFAIEGARLV